MIKSKNTKPEMVVRKALTKLGYRYRLHAHQLPGKPDIVFKKKKKIIFVNGCFWHRHHDCAFATNPKTNKEFWEKKFSDNVLRDEKNYALLSEMKWRILVIWECEVKDTRQIEKTLAEFLEP